MRSLILFSISGGLGFLVDAGMYYLLSIYASYYWAKLLSFISAVFTTWLFNRSITFRHISKSSNVFLEFSKYFISMLFGGVINYIVFIFLIEKYYLIKEFPILGIAFGSISGLVCNFLLSKFVVYKH